GHPRDRARHRDHPARPGRPRCLRLHPLAQRLTGRWCMVSRRDQLQAYRFMTRRSAGALLRDDSDTVEAPLRRLSGGAAASVMVALLAAAVVGLFGLFSPGGSTSWQDSGSLILEKETGTRYVYLNGVLHPVINYASARLVLRGGAGVVQVSQSSLAGTPHGA